MNQGRFLEASKRVWNWTVRYRFQIWDAAVVASAAGIALFLAAEYQMLRLAGVDAQTASEIEFAELLIIIAGLGLSLFVSIRRSRAQSREIKRRIEAETLARHLAFDDPLTGLPNRRKFDETLKAAIDAPPGSELSHAVLLLDLNGFKGINDTYGHPAGDEVLKVIGARLIEVVRDTDDHVARLGGDEFGLVATHLRGSEDANTIAMRIVDTFKSPIKTSFGEFTLGTGIGVSLFPQDGSTAAEIMRRADVALYRAKDGATFGVSFFEPEMDARLRERAHLERELRLAVAHREIVPHYQPVVTLHSGRIAGFEALARWHHPEIGNVAPDRFIPLAESCGLMRELGDHLLRTACLDARDWPARTVLSFNVSPAQLRDPTFGLRVMTILNETGFSPSRLELEITENTIVSDLRIANDSLVALRSAGVRIALDDFGTGYSSLYHLRNFAFDRIKIDRSFVASMGSEVESAAIVKALLGLAHGLGVPVTAEGIEHLTQKDELSLQGCDHGQGFLISPAVSSAGAAAMFAQEQDEVGRR